MCTCLNLWCVDTRFFCCMRPCSPITDSAGTPHSGNAFTKKSTQAQVMKNTITLSLGCVFRNCTSCDSFSSLLHMTKKLSSDVGVFCTTWSTHGHQHTQTMPQGKWR